MHAKLDELIGTVQAKARRESIFYSGVIVPMQLRQLFDLLKEVSMAPLVTDADLEELKSVITYELAELRNKPDELMPELSHGPAFYSNCKLDDYLDWNSTVGIPQDLKRCTINTVMEFWRKNFATQNMIVVGAGMSHGELHNVAADTFGQLEKYNNWVREGKQDLKYVGGSNYIESEDLPLVHVAVGFEGCSAASEQVFPLAILHMLMGGGSSFSAGGPGKGMYSRLYTQVLNRYHWIESCKIFDFFYKSTGLFGIHGSALPSNARDLAEVLLDQLYGMTQPLTSTELERAKNQVKSSLLMGLESRLTEVEDLSDQASYLNGNYRSVREICDRIDRVTSEDIQATAMDLLDSKPTVVAYGPLHRMPSYDMILKWHKARLTNTNH